MVMLVISPPELLQLILMDLMYPKILCLTDVFIEVALMPLWSYRQVLILINYSQNHHVAYRPLVVAGKGLAEPRQPKNSLLEI